MMIKINDEYLCAVRTKSFVDFFVEAQHVLAYPTHCHPSDLLLNPGQEAIASLLPKSPPHLKSLFSDYFDVSADASRLCTNLLGALIRLRSTAQILDGNNPFSDLNELEEIRERHSCILQQLRSSRKKMAGKLRLIGGRRMMRWFGIFECGLVVEQLDAAAKGAYVLKRDFDTIGRLVARIGAEIRGGCLEFGVRRQAEEMEEHVYLCLLTINRARALLVTQISAHH